MQRLLPSSQRIDRFRYVDTPIDGRQYDRMKLVQTIDAECCPQVLASPLGEDEAERLAGARIPTGRCACAT